MAVKLTIGVAVVNGPGGIDGVVVASGVVVPSVVVPSVVVAVVSGVLSVTLKSIGSVVFSSTKSVVVSLKSMVMSMSVVVMGS